MDSQVPTRRRPLSLFVAPIALLILAIWNVVRDFRWDYTYSFVSPQDDYVLAIASTILVINLFSRRWDREVSLWARRSVFALLAVVTWWVYDYSNIGFRWILNQTAVDLPANLQGDAADRYWNAFVSRFGDTPAFGGIRALYELYGANLALNQQTVFLDSINGGTDEDVVYLLTSVDSMPWPVPVGYVLLLFAVIGQLYAHQKSQEGRTRADAG